MTALKNSAILSFKEMFTCLLFLLNDFDDLLNFLFLSSFSGSTGRNYSSGIFSHTGDVLFNVSSIHSVS